MMDKLMQLLGYIQIGRKIILFIIMSSLVTSSCCFFCEQVSPDRSYRAILKNNSVKTITLQLGTDTGNYLNRFFTILPNDSALLIDGIVGVDNEENPVKDLLSGTRTFTEQARVYIDDDLIVDWKGPPRYLGDTINHFFNYDSWEIIEYSANEQVDGEIRFAIDKKDLE